MSKGIIDVEIDLTECTDRDRDCLRCAISVLQLALHRRGVIRDIGDHQVLLEVCARISLCKEPITAGAGCSYGRCGTGRRSSRCGHKDVYVHRPFGNDADIRFYLDRDLLASAKLARGTSSPVHRSNRQRLYFEGATASIVADGDMSCVRLTRIEHRDKRP